MTKKIHLIILFSQFIILLALEMGNPFLSLFIAEQAHIPFQSAALYTALAFALPMIANIIMGPIWGLAADRFGAKVMLMRAAWALVITQGLMIFANNLLVILFIRILQGGFAGFIAAMQAYLVSFANKENKSTYLAQLQSSKALATSLAGVAGGLLLCFFHFKGLFFIATLLCLIVTLLMHYQLPAVHTKTFSPTLSSMLTKKFDGLIIFLGVLITFTQIAKFFPDAVFALKISQDISTNPFIIGALYSLPAAGLLLTSTFCGKLFDYCRKNPVWIKIYLFSYGFLGVLVMLLHANATTFPLLALARFLWGLIFAALLPALIALMSDCYLQQGMAIGIANSFAKLGNLIGIIFGGWVGGLLDLRQIFLIIAGIYLLFMLISVCINFATLRNRVANSLMPCSNEAKGTC